MARRIFLAALLCLTVLFSPAFCKEAASVDSEEVATTEPTPQAMQPVDIMKAMVYTVTNQLDTTSTPWANELVGALAVVFGIIMLFCGNLLFKYTVFAGVGICVFCLSTTAMAAKVQAGFPMFVVDFVAAGVAVVFMYAAREGYEGVRVLLGFGLGALGFFGTHIALSKISGSGADGWVFFLVLGAGWIALGVHVFKSDLHMKAIAVLTPIVGGFLCSSSIAFFAVFLTGEDRRPAWILFAAMLANPNSEPVGALPREALYLLWFIFSSIGGWIQMQYVTKFHFVREVFKKKDLDGDGTISKLEVLAAIQSEENVKAHFGMQGLSDEEIEERFLALESSKDGTFTERQLMWFYFKITFFKKTARAREGHTLAESLLHDSAA